MKNLKYVFLLATIAGANAFACTNSTIDSIIGPINPYKQESAGLQMQTALETLSLCDENLNYAGLKLGAVFNPYQEYATAAMAAAINQAAIALPPDLISGLGLGIIDGLNLYQYSSTVYMLNSILMLGQSAPDYAKQFALQLLKQQNGYQDRANRKLLDTVSALRRINIVTPPPPTGSPIWAFRSNNETCSGVNGPWGYYELCPRYFASVSDQFGNRIVLACKSENFGIEFRVSLGRSSWNSISNTSIESLAFGTNNIMQTLGIPYVIFQASTLMAQEPMAHEVLSQLRTSNALAINIRSNSGEINTRLNFSLQGSNVAIGQLLQFCR